MIHRFELEGDGWFQLYEDCGKRVPTFMGDTFLAGSSVSLKYTLFL